METAINQRLKKILEFKNLSVNALAKMIDMPQVTVNNYVRGERKISFELIERVANAFPDISQQWLLTGEGDMLNSNVTLMRKSELEEFTTTKAGLKFFTREDGQLVMKVPIVPIAALGSPDDEFADIIKEHEGDTVSIVVDAVHHGNYVAFKIEGDSMDNGTRDSFEAGDIVVVRELSRDKWLPKLHYKQWPFWVVAFGNCVRIKQIIAQDEEAGTITLHSLNPSPEYTDFTLHLDSIYKLYNVVQHVPKIRMY